MIRGFLRTVSVLVLTACCSVPPYFLGLVGSTDRAARVMRWWGKAFLRVGGWSMDVRGMENLPGSGAVIVSNHQSLVDIPLLLSAFPRPVCFLSKSELRRIPVFGRAMAAAGNIFVDRKDPKDAPRMFGEAAEHLKSGRLIVFFAEGRRTRDGSIGAFKTGAFRLARDAGVPVLPVFIDGGYRAIPRGGLRFHPARLLVMVLPPLSPEEMAADVKERVAPLARQRILAAAEAASRKEAG